MPKLETIKYYNMMHDGETIFSFSNMMKLKSATHKLGLPFLSGQRYGNEWFATKYRDQIVYYWEYDQKALSIPITSEAANDFDLLDKGLHNRIAYWLCCLRVVAPDLVTVMRPYLQALYVFRPLAQLQFSLDNNELTIKEPFNDSFYRAWFNDQNQLTELRKIGYGSVHIELIGKEITPDTWQKALKIDYDMRMNEEW